MRRFRTLGLSALLLSLFFFAGCTERVPEIEKGEFPFKLEYQYKGETVQIADTVVCEFTGLTPHYIVPGKFRTWEKSLKSGDKRDNFTILKEVESPSMFQEGRMNIDARVFIDYGSPEYYMGDTKKNKVPVGAPSIQYIEHFRRSENESEYTLRELTMEEAEKYFGIQILVWEFSEPITNSFDKKVDSFAR